MKVPFLLLLSCAQLLNGLNIRQEPEKKGKYGYVTMWLNKEKVPEHVFQHVLSHQETVNLNQAQIDPTSGLPVLSKYGAKMSLAETGADGPKKDAPEPAKFKIPLRPRNSHWRGILDIAQNLRDVGSEVPLVVLTNEEVFLNQTLRDENPNLQFIWVNDTDFIQRHCKIGAGHELHFQKLAIWKLTQFDKLLWIDTDIAFTKSVDYIFTAPKFKLHGGSRVYGQVDDYQCDGREWSPTSGGICSGAVLFQPSSLHFQGLMMHQSKMQNCWGDQSIIGSYFTSKGKEGRPFDRHVINFARCSKKDGRMDMVHFSGSPNAKRVGDEGKRDKDGTVMNATAVALKAAEKSRKKALDNKKAVEQDKRNKKKWVEETKNAPAKAMASTQ